MSSKTQSITLIPRNATNICFGTRFTLEIICSKNVYTVFRGISTSDPNTSSLSKTRTDREMVHKANLWRTTNCTSESKSPSHNLPLGFRARQMASPVPIWRPPSSCSSSTGHWLPLWAGLPAFKRLLTCTVLPKQHSSSWLSSPTAKTHWPNLFRQLDL